MNLPNLPTARHCYNEDVEVFEVRIPTSVSDDLVTDLAYLFHAMAKADLPDNMTLLKAITCSYDSEEGESVYEVVVSYV